MNLDFTYTWILLLNVCSCQDPNGVFFSFSQNSIRVQNNSHKCFGFLIKIVMVQIYIKHYYQIRIRSAISIIFDLHRILRGLKSNSIVYSVLFCSVHALHIFDASCARYLPSNKNVRKMSIFNKHTYALYSQVYFISTPFICTHSELPSSRNISSFFVRLFFPSESKIE